jgi:hypothetical protein
MMGMIPSHFPRLYAGETPIRRWFSPDGRRQVVLLRCSDGFWSYCGSTFHLGCEFECMGRDEWARTFSAAVPEDIEEEWWDEGHDSLYDTLETALRNLREQFPWIQDVAAEELNTAP